MPDIEHLRAESFGHARAVAHRRWGTLIAQTEDYQAQTFTVSVNGVTVAIFDCSPPTPAEALEQIAALGRAAQTEETDQS